MKFLCIACDEQMKLDRTLPPDENAISAVFTCPNCGASFAMHTNSMETQLVKSLGVKIGGAPTAQAPMQTVRETLTGAKDLTDSAHPDAVETTPSSHEAGDGSKCPFTGAVTEAYTNSEQASAPSWTAEASARLERVPSFIRSMVKKGIEDVAKQKGYTEITEEVMAEVRTEIGM